MYLRRFFRLLWFAASTFGGGFVGWLAIAILVNLSSSMGKPPGFMIIYALLFVGVMFGALVGATFARMGEMPHRFSLRTLLINTTLLAFLLGAASYLSAH
jgi:hypothetical protein